MVNEVSGVLNVTDENRDIDSYVNEIESNVREDIEDAEWVPESEVGLHTLEVPPDDPAFDPDILHSRGFKVAAASAAALSVMGLAGLAHSHQAGEVAEHHAPPPVVEQAEPDEITIDISELQKAYREAEQQPQAETQEQETTPNRDRGPVRVSEQIEMQQVQDIWWHDVPNVSQHGLKYDGRPTVRGCAPTATHMVLEYWHAQNDTYQTLSAQELLNLNAAEGEFSHGMSMTDMHDQLQELGYTAQDHLDSDLETLKAQVAQGPVVATVKFNMAALGNNHSVVVTGISEDNQVRVGDPWTGESHTYTWQEFSRSWGADFGPGTSTNNFTVIRPS